MLWKIHFLILILHFFFFFYINLQAKNWHICLRRLRACCTLCKHTSIFLLILSPQCAGVGNALEGGRGRAGTKLFQDFQMLSRIWTHPWCLHLDYISKENRVWPERNRLNLIIETVCVRISHTVGNIPTNAVLTNRCIRGADHTYWGCTPTSTGATQ